MFWLVYISIFAALYVLAQFDIKRDLKRERERREGLTPEERTIEDDGF